MLSNISFHGSLLALVVEVKAGHQVEVLASSTVAADSQSASPRLPTTDLHDVDAVVERGEVGEELVGGVELGGWPENLVSGTPTLRALTVGALDYHSRRSQ